MPHIYGMATGRAQYMGIAAGKNFGGEHYGDMKQSTECPGAEWYCEPARNQVCGKNRVS